MSSDSEPVEIAVLDDYQDVALEMADWSVLNGRARITVFRDHIADDHALIEQLRPFDVVCVMRERTPLSRNVIESLPRLKMIASTGPRNRSVDVDAAAERGIVVTSTGYFSEPTVELTWALIHASIRAIVAESNSVRTGGWQRSVGGDLAGQVLGVLGLGNIGSRVAAVGTSFGMKVIAWSENLSRDRAESFGAELVSREELFRRSDILTVHLILAKYI
jgi:phosphoglycerate dehydrogenase-like enzyme